MDYKPGSFYFHTGKQVYSIGDGGVASKNTGT
jgi:hypothetical protein